MIKLYEENHSDYSDERIADIVGVSAVTVYRLRTKKRVLLDIKCPTCGTIFKPRHGGQIYCHTTCSRNPKIHHSQLVDTKKRPDKGAVIDKYNKLIKQYFKETK